VIKKDNFIFETFLKLTSNTYPYGYEDVLAEEMIKSGLFPEQIQKDQHGNYFIKIGESRTIFSSHLDTACKDHTSVSHVFRGNMIETDGKTILGADDKAGMTIMLWMMLHNIPGLYYFFIGEEVGCVGSGLASKYGDFKGKYDRMISFDRRGLDSVITYQSSSRCCSDDFGKQLAKQLNKSGLSYKTDDSGIYTDSAEFVDIIPECTNLSVGYYKEHTTGEKQDIEHLQKLAKACLLVNWEDLVTKRDMTKTEYKSHNYGYGSYGKTTPTHRWSNYGETDNWRSRDFGTKKSTRKDYGYHDDWYDQSESFKKQGRKYYDNGGELIDITENKKIVNTNSNKRGDSYEWIMSKFVGKLTEDDLDVIKEQYLDMDNNSDKLFYTYLVQYVNEQYQ
jgi:hypothetical protein